MAPNRPLTPVDQKRADLYERRKLRGQDGGPLSDFGESIPVRMDHILRDNPHPDFSHTVLTNNDNSAKTNPDTYTSVNADEHVPVEGLKVGIPNIALDRSNLRPNTSTIELIIREPMKDITYPILTYVGESGATDHGVSLLKFIDKKTGIIYAWNGKQAEGGAIYLRKGIIEGKRRTYHLCWYSINIARITY